MEVLDLSLLKIVKDNDWGHNDFFSTKLNQLIWWSEHPFIKEIEITIDYNYNDEGGSDPYLNFHWFNIREGFEEEFLDWVLSLDIELTAALCLLELHPRNYINPNDAEIIEMDCANDLVKRFKDIYDNAVYTEFYTKELKTTHPNVYALLLEFVKYLTTYQNGEFSDDEDYCCFKLQSEFAVEGLLKEMLNVFETETCHYDKYPEIDDIKAFIRQLWLKSTNISNSLKSIINQW
jgi:hypothetical protein